MKTPFFHFVHCPACGAVLGPQEPARLVHCDACGFHYHFNPGIGSGVILVAPDGRILLTRRLHDPGRGKFGLPGGFVDVGESAEDAVRREAREEIGAELAGLEYLCSRPNLYPYRGVTYNVLDLFFVGRLAPGAEPKPLDEVESCVWVRPEEIDLDAIAFPSIRAALELYLAQTIPPSP